jgi:Domain of unknown function (DUF4034)
MLDENSVPPRKGSQVTPFLAGILTVLIIGGVYLVARQQFAPPSVTVQAVQPSAQARFAAESLAAVLAEETSKLHLKPRTIVSSADEAKSAADALRQGDYRTAEKLTRNVLTRSQLGVFAFQPFDRYLGRLFPGNEPKVLDSLNAWISADEKSAIAHLLRASYYRQAAWSIRGEDYAYRVPNEHWQAFKENLALAEDDVRKSMALDPTIPSAYSLWLLVLASEGDAHKLDAAFIESIGRFPTAYDFYSIRLKFLKPKWGGSIGQMYGFVNQYAGGAPESSPLKLLYMQLSADLVNSASAECQSLAHELYTACVNAYIDRHVTGGLADGLRKGLDLYKFSDPVQYSAALWPILGGMLSSGGDSTSFNTVLQMAADAMGSDNQLIHEPGHNNYVLDDMTARIWVKLNNPVNVEQKFKEALDDIETMKFPNEEDKEVALARVYEDMAWVARNTQQYPKVIVYRDAANSVAGVNRGGTQYLKCFAYFKLNHFQETVEECTDLINTHRDTAEAHYYRARALEALTQYDAAIAEYTPIADDSSDYLTRSAAAIEIEHMTALRGNYVGELEVFKKYPFLFDTSLQDQGNLAIAFNNRCFAYMKLGELQKALDDCTTSLQYGRLPDALQKQQQLVKLLKTSETI